jgi:adenine deaminase
MKRFAALVFFALVQSFFPSLAANAQDARTDGILFKNVRVFDGKSAKLSVATDVLVRGSKIASVTKAAMRAGESVQVIYGAGRTLMPGMIDTPIHIFSGLRNPYPGRTKCGEGGRPCRFIVGGR